MQSRIELEGLPRERLVELARRSGVPRPEVMTRVELVDEIIRRRETDSVARRRARGWLGVARDLVASLIEQGLNMPDAAELVRTATLAPTRIVHQPPVATVTLAEIYAAQGHVRRALDMLEEVLAKEPDHSVARALFERLSASGERPRPAREPEADAELEPMPGSEPRPERSPDTAPPPAPAPIDPTSPAPAPIDPTSTAPAPIDPTSTAPAPIEPTSTGAEPIQPPAAAPPSSRPSPERDAILLVSGADDRVFLYWEASARAFEQVERKPGSALVARVVSISPGIFGSRRSERDFELAGHEGCFELAVVGRAFVRAALGVRDAEGFAPLAIATAVESDGDGRAGPSGVAARALAAYRAASAPR